MRIVMTIEHVSVTIPAWLATHVLNAVELGQLKIVNKKYVNGAYIADVKSFATVNIESMFDYIPEVTSDAS